MDEAPELPTLDDNGDKANLKERSTSPPKKKKKENAITKASRRRELDASAAASIKSAKDDLKLGDPYVLAAALAIAGRRGLEEFLNAIEAATARHERYLQANKGFGISDNVRKSLRLLRTQKMEFAKIQAVMLYRNSPAFYREFVLGQVIDAAIKSLPLVTAADVDIAGGYLKLFEAKELETGRKTVMGRGLYHGSTDCFPWRAVEHDGYVLDAMASATAGDKLKPKGCLLNTRLFEFLKWAQIKGYEVVVTTYQLFSLPPRVSGLPSDLQFLRRRIVNLFEFTVTESLGLFEGVPGFYEGGNMSLSIQDGLKPINSLQHRLEYKGTISGKGPISVAEVMNYPGFRTFLPEQTAAKAGLSVRRPMAPKRDKDPPCFCTNCGASDSSIYLGDPPLCGNCYGFWRRTGTDRPMEVELKRLKNLGQKQSGQDRIELERQGRPRKKATKSISAPNGGDGPCVCSNCGATGSPELRGGICRACRQYSRDNDGANRPWALEVRRQERPGIDVDSTRKHICSNCGRSDSSCYIGIPKLCKACYNYARKHEGANRPRELEETRQKRLGQLEHRGSERISDISPLMRVIERISAPGAE